MHQPAGIPPAVTTRLATSRSLPLETHDLGTFDDLVDLVSGGGVVVLSGAGLSTESGIPDYRGPDGTRRVEPMTYGEFAGSSEARRRYWARSYIGWQRFNAASPNEGHRVVTELQREGYVGPVITQNVDGLHQAAGASDVVELHGSLDRAVCLTCGEVTTRLGLHERMTEANPGFMERFAKAAAAVGSQWGEQVRPDGDIVLEDSSSRRSTRRAASSVATTPSSPTSSSSASRCRRAWSSGASRSSSRPAPCSCSGRPSR